MTSPPGSLVVGFLEALASERGASANTIEAYRRALSDYEGRLREQGTDPLKAGATTAISVRQHEITMSSAQGAANAAGRQ